CRYFQEPRSRAKFESRAGNLNLILEGHLQKEGENTVQLPAAKKLGKKGSLIAIVVTVIVVIAGVSSFFAHRTAAASEFFTEPVQRGPIRNVVNATGTLQAVLTVQVGS